MISSSGESGETRGGKCGHFLSPQCVSDFVPGRVCLRGNAGELRCQIDCYHPCLSSFCSSLLSLCSLCVCSSRACLHSVWSTAAPCGGLLPTNQTSQCHRKASSKTHGHVSSLHSADSQCLAGLQNRLRGLNEPRSDERKTTATEHLEDNITNEACVFVFFPLLLVCTYLHARRWMRTGCLHVSAHVFSCHSYRRVRGGSVCTRSQFTS